MRTLHSSEPLSTKLWLQPPKQERMTQCPVRCEGCGPSYLHPSRGARDHATLSISPHMQAPATKSAPSPVGLPSEGREFFWRARMFLGAMASLAAGSAGR